MSPLSQDTYKDKEVTSVRTAKKELQLSLFAINLIICIENLPDSTEVTRPSTRAQKGYGIQEWPTKINSISLHHQ